MKILFLMRHSGYVRNFESTLRMLGERGRRVEIAFQVDGAHALLDTGDITQELCTAYPRFSRSVAPERKDSWGLVARELRLTLDYMRYLQPMYRDAPKLRERAARVLTPGTVERLERGLAGTALGRKTIGKALRALHAAIPTSPHIDAFLEARRPDLLVVTPLIQPGAPQAEYLRSARRLGIRTALCVASWDNLTNKGIIHGSVDLVTVWNEMMRREAVELHGVPPERVVVTGAQPFDHWFGWEPTGRESFCRRVGLPESQPYVLYLCSSRFIAPEEVPFVRRWLEHLRQTPALRNVGVLVRPHPQNADQWRGVLLTDLGPVAVWPPAGAVPADAQSRAEYFDSIYHSAAVVGINTTAEIESAIIGRSVYTVLAPEFRDTQEGTLHFRHLRDVSGGLVHVAETLPEHAAQLGTALSAPSADLERCRRFVKAFVRPFGLNAPATPRLVKALEQLVRQAAPAPQRERRWVSLVQPALARRGEELQRETSLLTETRAIRHAARAQRRTRQVDDEVSTNGTVVPTAVRRPAPAPSRHWKKVLSSYLALEYRDRIRFGRAVMGELPGELLLENVKSERLDYPGVDIHLRVISKAERHRLHACAKEPFTIDWIQEWIQPGEVFYDIGANVGVYSLVAACMPQGGARVFAFEPSYANVASLSANVVLNGVSDSVTCFPVALSNVTSLTALGLRTLQPGGARHSLENVASEEEEPVVHRQAVLAFRLDDLVSQMQLPLPNHIKLDVDGGELAVLEGAKETLASPSLRSLLVEVSVGLSDELTEEMFNRGLRLERRFNVANKAGEHLIWYGLFTRAPEGATSEHLPRVEVFSR